MMIMTFSRNCIAIDIVDDSVRFAGFQACSNQERGRMSGPQRS